MLQFVEFKQIGLNAATLSAIFIIAFSCLRVWALKRQLAKIRNLGNRRTGAGSTSISMVWLVSFLFLHTFILVYGCQKLSLALIINGLVGYWYFRNVYALWIIKGFTPKELCIVLVCFMVLILGIVLPHESKLFIALVYLSCIPMCAQAYEIRKRRNSVGVELCLVVLHVIAAFVWVVFSFAANDKVLMLVMPAHFCIFLFTLFLWIIYRKRKT